jgi:Ca2+-binding RTX toxin-like protein
MTTLTNVTISGNSAAEEGGGLVAYEPVSLNNVTITGNTANSDGDASGDGGGIVQAGGAITIRNSIVAGNVDGGGEAPDCSGPVASGGHNILGSGAGCSGFTGVGDLVGVDPLLGPLADNGGPTPTHALLKGSPAVDAGGTDCAPTDQRGLPRNCDVGAYELVLCRTIPVNRIGSAGKDALLGTSASDGILGFAGKDTLRGKGGRDGLCGGPGKDLLKGGGGKDLLDGGPGKDRCVGQAGRDRARACETEKSVP